MSRTPKPMRTETGYSTPDSITVYGKNLCTEVLGKVNLGDMGFLGLTGRLPTPQESVVFNAITVTWSNTALRPRPLPRARLSSVRPNRCRAPLLPACWAWATCSSARWTRWPIF